MKKIILALLVCLSAHTYTHAQTDEAFATKFATNWCNCVDKYAGKLSPDLKQKAINAIKNPTTDSTMNVKPYFDYLEQHPKEKKIENKVQDNFARCITSAFKPELEKKSLKEAKTYVIKGLLSNNHFISKQIAHNDMANFYYALLFNKLLQEYNLSTTRTKK